MGERTTYTPGTFCWTELHTPDREAAKAFYGELFGWESEDTPVAEGTTYTMARRDGKAVAAMSDHMGGGQEPPNWFNYVSVDDVDAAARAVSDTGGKVMMEPFDVMEAGRMAVVTDAQGAYFGLWQAGESIGISQPLLDRRQPLLHRFRCALAPPLRFVGLERFQIATYRSSLLAAFR